MAQAPYSVAYMFYDRPNYCAGPRINALRLLPELVRRGYQVTALINYKGDCPAQAVLEEQGVSVRAAPWPAYVEDQVAWLYDVLAMEQPQVFVPNISVGGCYAARFVRESGRPTIAGHLSDDRFNWGMAQRFCKAGDRWAVSGMFCMGAQLAEPCRQWQPRRTQVVEIPHGVPMPQTLAEPKGPIRMVYAGRLEDRQKRIGAVVESMIAVLQRDPCATAKLIGDGNRRGVIEETIRHSGVEDRFTLTGHVPPEQVQREMQSGNVLVLLSDFEGVPGAVMDGMSCGLTPVCLDISGGLRELIIPEQTGLLVSDRRESFLNAIERLASDIELRRRLSAHARRHIEARFSLTNSADRWERLFHDLITTAGARRPLRFPPNPVLPLPYPAFGGEDKRRPSFYQKCLRLPRGIAQYGKRRLLEFGHRMESS